MKKLFLLLVFSIFMSCSQQPQVKNVILIIGDGTGFNQQQAGSYYLYGKADMLHSQRLPVQLASTTFSTSGHGYDATLAHSDFEYLKEKPTDSAASGTALATGVKTYNGAIGVDPQKNTVENIMEQAEATGRATGVVTSVPFSHATPAAFTAHDSSRNNYHAIAHDQIMSACEVIMGAGHPFYDADGQMRDAANFKYISQVDFDALKNGVRLSDADADGEKDAWTFVENKLDFIALVDGETPDRVFGVPQVASTLQSGRSGADETVAPFDTPQLETIPSLAEMSKAALNILDNDPDGFYLMIEAGAIDWTCHANNGPRMIEEVVDMENSVKAVIDWVENHSSWDETVIIVTADHETGYLLGPGSGEGSIWNPVANRGEGIMPALEWHEGGHTNSLVPVQAKGARVDELAAFATRTDNIIGKYMDNTDIYKFMSGLLK